MLSLTLTLPLLWLAPIAPQVTDTVGAVESQEAVEDLLARPVLLGASMSSGYGIPAVEPFAAILSETLKLETPMPSIADMLFFTMPMEMGSEHSDFAIDADATVVFAIDFLFWFGYGVRNVDSVEITSEDERLELLEIGLEHLDQLDCLLVVGDFPNMTKSLGKMLGEKEMPEPETLVRLNARVKEWAAERENTLIIPLDHLVQSLNSEEAIDLGRFAIGAEAKSGLIQEDELHPTRTGICLMAHMVALALMDAGFVEDDHLELDMLKVLESFDLDTTGIKPLEPDAEDPDAEDPDKR
ncbi:MAG: hypothetical protein ACI8PQ_001315 [Planctomycetota bacterium]|jgi:hypothetical protein